MKYNVNFPDTGILKLLQNLPPFFNILRFSGKIVEATLDDFF